MKNSHASPAWSRIKQAVSRYVIFTFVIIFSAASMFGSPEGKIEAIEEEELAEEESQVCLLPSAKNRTETLDIKLNTPPPYISRLSFFGYTPATPFSLKSHLLTAKDVYKQKVENNSSFREVLIFINEELGEEQPEDKAEELKQIAAQGVIDFQPSAEDRPSKKAGKKSIRPIT
jgi:hypothetical protein